MANFISFTGLFFAVSGIVIAGRVWTLSILFLMAAGICDLFDGYIARRINSQNNTTGKQIDSLIDVVSFGLLPVAIFISIDTNLIIGILISFIYLGCAVWRLALFNATASERSYFTGFPVTFVSLVLPVVLIFFFIIQGKLIIWILRSVMLILSILFVSKVKFKKPRGIGYVIYSGTGLLLIIVWTVIFLKYR
jgi:CDP-diacylglycerol--serine O-phosphatidyltransferase